jgi:protein phosphatase
MMNFLKKLFKTGKSNMNIHKDLAYGLTDTGREREGNEDYFLIDLKRRLYIVADGMGGHNSGEVASKCATEAVHEYLTQKRLSQMALDQNKAEKEMKKCSAVAHDKIIETAKTDSDHTGMGSTLVVAWIDGATLHLCHVGDARAYVCDDQVITLLTTDHSVVMALVKAGNLTMEEARNSQIKNELTQALGAPRPLAPDYSRHLLKNGDRVLLCSDGLWDMLSDDEIHQILKQNKSVELICQDLIDAANNAGGKDNITAVVIAIGERNK